MIITTCTEAAGWHTCFAGLNLAKVSAVSWWLLACGLMALSSVGFRVVRWGGCPLAWWKKVHRAAVNTGVVVPGGGEELR